MITVILALQQLLSFVVSSRGPATIPLKKEDLEKTLRNVYSLVLVEPLK